MNKAIALVGPLVLAVGVSDLKAAPPERFMGFNTYAPNAETLRHFAEAGVNTVVCFPANVLASTGEPYNNVYPPIWNGPGIYDFECLDRQVTDKLAVNPKAKFIFFIDLNTPTWWCRIRGCPDSFNDLGGVAANPVWRRDTREYLQAVLRHLESKHRDVIVGYFLACGKTIEWQDFNKGEASEIRRAAWRRWMIERGQPDPVDIPPASVRDHVSHGPFRDPVDDALAIHYWRFSLRLISGISTYWFDLFGRWFEGEAVYDSIAQMRKLWDRLARPREESVAEVAVLVDAESMYYLDGKADFYNDLLYKQRYGLYRMGTPFDLFSVGDLATLDLSRYKLVFLPNLFVTDAKRRSLLRDKVCTGGKTVLWGYSPGIIADGKYDPRQVEALTGIPWEAEELTSRGMDGWRSVYSPRANVPADVLRGLAREAGVHIYCEAEDPLYANDRLIALHTITGGPRTIVLPKKCRRVTEVFSGRVVAENTDRFEDTLAPPCTVLYEVEQ